MEKLKLGAILAIVVATIAVILILWNLRLNDPRVLTIVPGPTILVNGECGTNQECIDGRNCFGGRCTQLVGLQNNEQPASTPDPVVTPPPVNTAPTCCDYNPTPIGPIVVQEATTFSGFSGTCSWNASDPFTLTITAPPTTPPEGETIYLASVEASNPIFGGNTAFHVLTASEVESTNSSGGWIDPRVGVLCGLNHDYQIQQIVCALPAQNAVASNLRESVTEDYYSIDVNWDAITDAVEYAVSVRLSCTHGAQNWAHQQFAGGRIAAPTTSSTFDFLVAANDNFPYVVEEVRVYGYRQCAIDNGTSAQTTYSFSGI